MTKENYDFSDGVKNEARRRAKPFNQNKHSECHHIVNNAVARKYNLPRDVIGSIENCIALDLGFHSWLHGGRFCEADHECDWKGLTEEDIIFLAIAYLGIDESYFNK